MPFKVQDVLIKILLAEDDADDRFFFTKALEEIPVITQLNTVNDGEALMKYLLGNYDNLPDLLFLDLSMPRKTGFECLIEIKENDKFKNIPVIVFSTSFKRDSDFEREMVDRLYKTGAVDFIRKATDFAQIKQIIQDAINKLQKRKLQ